MSIAVLIVLIGFINFASAFIQASCGFGYAMVAMSLMPLLMSMRQCASISAITVVVIAVQMCMTLGKHLVLRKVCIPVISCMMTIPVGMYFLMHFDEILLRRILASAIILLTLFFLYTRKRNIRITGTWYQGLAAGLITGISTGMFNIVGPFFMVYYVSIMDDMLSFKASMEFSFLIAGLYSVVMHTVQGNITGEMLPYYAVSAVGACIAGRLGLYVFKKINKEKMTLIVYFLLPVLALMLLLNS